MNDLQPLIEQVLKELVGYKYGEVVSAGAGRQYLLGVRPAVGGDLLGLQLVDLIFDTPRRQYLGLRSIGRNVETPLLTIPVPDNYDPFLHGGIVDTITTVIRMHFFVEGVWLPYRSQHTGGGT